MRPIISNSTTISLCVMLISGCATSKVDQTPPMDLVKETPINITTVEEISSTANEKPYAMLEKNVSTTKQPNVYFEYDSSVLSEDAIEILSSHIHYLKNHPALSITIEGHADDRGTDEYNSVLGRNRALAIKDIMISRNISEDKIDLISYGENKPAINSHTEVARSLNRRATIVYHNDTKQLVSR